jgi:phage gp16-like protein
MNNAAKKTNPVRAGLIGKIHVAKKQLGLDDDTYRAVLRRVTGKDSSSGCSISELEDVKAEMVYLGFKPVKTAHPRAGKRPLADGETATKLRALWISGYHLAVVNDPSEAALAAFVKRATGGKKRGVDALQWMTADDARKAIEALKAWLTRAGGVDWAVKWHEGDRGSWPRRDVVKAQYAILRAAGKTDAVTLSAFLSSHGRMPILSIYQDSDVDALIDFLGAFVREAKVDRGQ